MRLLVAVLPSMPWAPKRNFRVMYLKPVLIVEASTTLSGLHADSGAGREEYKVRGQGLGGQAGVRCGVYIGLM